MLVVAIASFSIGIGCDKGKDASPKGIFYTNFSQVLTLLYFIYLYFNRFLFISLHLGLLHANRLCAREGNLKAWKPVTLQTFQPLRISAGCSLFFSI